VVCKAFGGLDTDPVCACTSAVEGTRKGDDSLCNAVPYIGWVYGTIPSSCWKAREEGKTIKSQVKEDMGRREKELMEMGIMRGRKKVIVGRKVLGEVKNR